MDSKADSKEYTTLFKVGCENPRKICYDLYAYNSNNPWRGFKKYPDKKETSHLLLDNRTVCYSLRNSKGMYDTNLSYLIIIDDKYTELSINNEDQITLLDNNRDCLTTIKSGSQNMGIQIIDIYTKIQLLKLDGDDFCYYENDKVLLITVGAANSKTPVTNIYSKDYKLLNKINSAMPVDYGNFIVFNTCDYYNPYIDIYDIKSNTFRHITNCYFTEKLSNNRAIVQCDLTPEYVSGVNQYKFKTIKVITFDKPKTGRECLTCGEDIYDKEVAFLPCGHTNMHKNCINSTEGKQNIDTCHCGKKIDNIIYLK
jgi:hypothetical protein